MAYLIIRNEDQGTVKVSLSEKPLFIGRSSEKDICLRDLTVSNTHAKVTLEVGRYKVRDLQSTNGSFVNGEQITERALIDGDEIQIGNTVMVFFADRSPDPKRAESPTAGQKGPPPSAS